MEPLLQKKLSATNVWAMALGCIIGWGAFVMPGNTFLAKAGPAGTAIAMGLAAIIMIIIAFNYHFMLNKYPVAGGEFAYTQRAFGQTNAFVCSWFLGLSYLAIVPLNATALALIGRNLMNNVFQWGFHYNVVGYDVYLGEILLAVSALLLFGLLSIRGVKFAGVFQTVLVFMLVFGVLAITVSAVAKGEVSTERMQPLFSKDGFKLSGILAVIAVAPWAFVGFDTVPQAAEEFQFSPRKTKLIMCISIIFGAGVYVILNTITAMVIPSRFANWADYIADMGQLSGMEALPTFNAAHLLLGRIGLLLIGFAVLAAILSGIIGFYMATSRLLYSMSKENVLPRWFGEIDGKYNTPKHAVIFVMLVSLIAPFFGRTALGWIVDMSSIGAAIGYGYTSAAAFRFARKEKNVGIMITGILGLLMSVAFSVLLLVPIPMFSCSLGKESYICLGVWILLGGIFYLYAKRRKGENR